MTKLEFHRSFSKQGHALSRTVPRLFIFDCCDGDGDFGKFKKDAAKNGKEGGNKEEKQLAAMLELGDADVADVVPPEQEQELEDGDEAGAEQEDAEPEPSVSAEAVWAHNTEHPDYQLAELNASRWGFQSKLNTGSGSYLISGFVERAEKELAAKGYVPRIGAMFKEIQDELRLRNKQLPSYIWNNNTENIQLYKRDVDAEQDKTLVVLDDGNYMELMTPQSAKSNGKRPELELAMYRSQSEGKTAQEQAGTV